MTRCKHLRVTPDADGKTRVRKANAYPCTVVVGVPALPKSMELRYWPKPTHMTPEMCKGCSFYEPVENANG